MLRLMLLRHAKSDWEPGVKDFDRRLAPRGIRNAPQMAKLIATRLTPPDAVWCSSAARTRETWQLMTDEIGDIPTIVTDDIYEASTRALEALIQGLPADVKTAMVIGHNPGIHATALSLAGSGDTTPLRRLAVKYPTCALAVLTFDVESWRDVTPGTGYLAEFIKPKDLAA